MFVHNSQNVISEKLSIQAFERFLSKHTAFLKHITQPLNNSRQYYSQLQFVFGLPTLLSRERIIFRNNKSIIHSYFVDGSMLGRIKKYLSSQKITQTFQRLQNKTTNLFVTNSQKIERITSKTGMDLSLPVIRKVQSEHQVNQPMHRDSRPVVFDSRKASEMLVRTFKGNSEQTMINHVVPGVIKQYSGISSEARPDHNKISGLQNFNFNFIQTPIKKEIRTLIRDYRYLMVPQSRNNAVIYSDKKTQKVINSNTTNPDQGYIQNGMYSSHRIQQQTSLPDRENTLATSFKLNNLLGLAHQFKPLQEKVNRTAKKQNILQQSLNLIHPQSVATATLPKHKTETISDQSQPVYSLPKPAGIAEPAREHFTDLKELTDIVMEQIEQRIKTEQERRGIFV